jgi:hypothetical protein
MMELGRRMIPVLVRLAAAVLAALAVACGQMPQESSSSASECGKLASAYLAAFRAATACTPGVVSPCTAQRPLVAAQAGSSAPEGLCWVAYLGMLEPDRASALDPLIDAYTSAGCTIGFCPGPGPHTTECLENDRGTYSCGGD